jgi:hypothetical protein
MGLGILCYSTSFITHFRSELAIDLMCVGAFSHSFKQRRFEALRPLGSAELIPVPFVTEKTDVYLAVLVTDPHATAFQPLVSSWASTASSTSSKLHVIVGFGPVDSEVVTAFAQRTSNCSGKRWI